ncbi:MAG: metalloregulator ArsR/SmtB family transcription factor [Eubacteriales bacterium]|nr:metalloregulator ArsR/SmtB family transcription factor [Eubacteriales bacterium]
MTDKEFDEIRQKFLNDFEQARPVMEAIGDVVRQEIIVTLIETGGTGGIRVGEIQKRTNISRSAVSHHLRVLRDAQVINVRREGTKNYYFLDPKSSSLRQVAGFWEQVEPMMALCGKRTEEELIKGRKRDKGYED